jgi:hypothetical protein
MTHTLADFSLRCPGCRGTNLTSDDRRNHRCLDCGERCTDKTALPSRVAVKGNKAKLRELLRLKARAERVQAEIRRKMKALGYRG